MFTDFLIVLTVLAASFLFMILTTLIRACLRYIRLQIFKPAANPISETAAVEEIPPIPPASPPPLYDDVIMATFSNASADDTTNSKRRPLLRADSQLPTYEQLAYLSLTR